MLVVIHGSLTDADAEGHLYEVFPVVELSASIMVVVDGNDSFPSLRIFSWSPDVVTLRERKVSLSRSCRSALYQILWVRLLIRHLGFRLMIVVQPILGPTPPLCWIKD